MIDQEQAVYVIDDDESIRKALSRLLRIEGYSCETFESAEAFFDGVDPRRSGCAVVDLNLPGLDGFAIQEQLSHGGRVMPVIFLTGEGTIPATVRAMKAGARDFLTKPVNGDTLLEAVLNAFNDLEASEQSPYAGAVDKLTSRESQVLEGVVAGLLNKQIAARLGIAEKTVKVHRARMMRKIGVRTVPELIRTISN